VSKKSAEKKKNAIRAPPPAAPRPSSSFKGRGMQSAPMGEPVGAASSAKKKEEGKGPTGGVKGGSTAKARVGRLGSALFSLLAGVGAAQPAHAKPVHPLPMHKESIEGPSPKEPGVVLVTDSYMVSIAGKLEKLPEFGSGEIRGGHLPTFLSKLHEKALRELGGAAPNPEEYLGGDGKREDAFGRMADDYILAYENLVKSLWKSVVSEAAKSRGKEKKREILEYGKRLMIALMCRPYAAYRDGPVALGEVDSLIVGGVPRDAFGAKIERSNYAEVAKTFGGIFEPQIRMLLGADYGKGQGR
jgi:hypothetical protein